MNQITAPYGFVPLAEKVVLPDWVQPRESQGGFTAPPLHDVPFEDGVCGTLELEVVAETPVFTRGTKGDGESFFSLPDGRWALPGTLLKGAIRSVIEAATFGRMDDRINDHRYAVRDLHNRDLYGRFMSDIVQDPRTRKREPMPLVNAGWLRRDPASDVCLLEVCDFAKIEYGMLERVAHERGARSFRPGEKQSSVAKYETWKGSREVDVTVHWQRPNAVNDRRMPSRYGKVSVLGGDVRGTLVFTGQPSRYKPDPMGRRRRGTAKHHDFVFIPTSVSQTMRVEARVFDDFEFGHSDRGQQNRLGDSKNPNEEWKHWKDRFEAGEPVPVFFLASQDGTAVTAMGLAMMFRLAYRRSIGEAVRAAQPGVAAYELDFADGLFGTVRKLDEASRMLALKGRVDFSHAVASSAAEPLDIVRTVLGAPKASYYPNYVEQVPDTPGANAPRDESGGIRYTTWQDDGARPRGWKRYRPLTNTELPEPPSGSGGRELSQDRVSSSFRPLPAGTRFAGRIHVHNVRPIELGALLWALDFGGDTQARHTLGMARPLGFGRCRLVAKPAADLRDVHGAPVDLDACRTAFVEYMGTEVPGWADTAQIRELLALARPVPPETARYQRLDPGRGVNEFVDAKKEGLALPLAHVGPRAAPTVARSSGGQRRAPFRDRGGPSPGRQSGPRGRGAPGQPAPPPQMLSAARRAWPGKKRGDTLEVTLTELNKKGKWRAQVVGHDAKGTIEGTPPADAEPGKQYDVEVIQGSDPRNLNLKWKDG